MWKEATVSSKGQLVIPKELREKLGLKAGEKVKLQLIEGKKVILQPSVEPPEDVYAEAGEELVEKTMRAATAADEKKIRELLATLGVRD